MLTKNIKRLVKIFYSMRLTQIKENKLIKQILGFLIAGCIANIVSFSIYVGFFNLLNISLFFSSISGQILGLLSNYLINSRFVFMKKLTIKFKFIYFIYYITNIYIVAISISFIESNGFNYIISWFICVITAAVVNFLFVKYLAFKK